MAKIILALGIALLGQNSFAGYVPPGSEMASCLVYGTNAQGQVFQFDGYGIHTVEACDNAMYFCKVNPAMVSCKVAGSSGMMSVEQQDQVAE